MAYKIYSKEDYDSVIKYKELGLSSGKVSELVDVPLSTIKNWFKGVGEIQYSDEFVRQRELDSVGYDIKTKQDFLNFVSRFNNLEPDICIALYSYLFGLYLGDGNIYDFGKTERLSYALDNKYLSLNEFTIDCMTRFFGKSPSILDKTNYATPSQSIILQTCSKHLDVIFPQHGSGLKNSRKIELEQWQKELLNPVEFLRGLIYSDGCYVVANGFNSNRYEFTNTSNDIIEIYKDNLDKLNIRHNSNTKKTLSVSELVKGKVYSSTVNIAWQDDVMWLFKRIGRKEFINFNLNIPDSNGYFNSNETFVTDIFNTFDENRKNLWKCKKCGKNTFIDDRDSYMVNDRLWLRLNKERKSGVVCLDCMEKYLTRNIESNDLKEHQLNKLNPVFRTLI